MKISQVLKMYNIAVCSISEGKKFTISILSFCSNSNFLLRAHRSWRTNCIKSNFSLCPLPEIIRMRIIIDIRKIGLYLTNLFDNGNPSLISESYWTMDWLKNSENKIPPRNLNLALNWLNKFNKISDSSFSWDSTYEISIENLKTPYRK